MIDAFALFDEPRRPWLEPDRLKEKFLNLSAEAHPDRVHGESEPERILATRRYAELNAAYQQLREPKDRLQLLLELELGHKPGQVRPIEPANLTLFADVARLCRSADELLKEQAGRSSPLLRVGFMERAADLVEQLRRMQTHLDERRCSLEEELRRLNPFWENAPAPGSPSRIAALPCDRIEQLLQDFSYLRRWNQQLQDRLVPLSCPS